MGTIRPKETSTVYTLTISNEEVTVCKKFYLHTVSIAETVVTTSLNKKKTEGGTMYKQTTDAHIQVARMIWEARETRYFNTLNHFL